MTKKRDLKCCGNCYHFLSPGTWGVCNMSRLEFFILSVIAGIGISIGYHIVANLREVAHQIVGLLQ